MTKTKKQKTIVKKKDLFRYYVINNDKTSGG